MTDRPNLPPRYGRRIERDHAVVQEGVPPGRRRTVALGELVSNFDSRRIPLSRRVRSERPGPYPYYGATGVMDHVDDYIFQGLHLLVAEDGSVETSAGRPVVQLVDGQFWVNNHAHVLRGTTDEETRYLYYALSTVQVRPFMSGSVQAKLSQRNLNQIPVPYPAEDSERRAIARILGALDDKIELNRRMSATLEAMARALFKSWFVDFEPVRAKAEGRPSGLPPALDALFPASFEASELGQIPSGWGVGTLGEVVEFAYGKALRAQDRRPGSVPVYGSNGQVGWHDERLVEGPGIVVGRKGNPGYVRWASRDFYPIDTTFYVVPRYSGLTMRFLFHALEGQDLPSIAADSAVPGLNRHLAYMNRQVVPPAPLVAGFTDTIRGALARVDRLTEESRALAAQRDTLLPRLVSGEVRVVESSKLVRW